MSSIPVEHDALLPLCAVLRWFDQGLLMALGGCDAATSATLLRSEHVVPVAERPGSFCLSDSSREAGLQRLRAERAADEVTLHTSAFGYFRDQATRHTGDEQRPGDETECMHHLDRLFFLLAARKEWSMFAAMVDSLRPIALVQPRHRHLLLFYEAAIANSAARYDEVEALLRRLLEQPDMDDSVRVRALNALAQAQFFQTHYDRALDLYGQVAQLARTTGDLFYAAVALINMGMIYNDLAYYARAIELTEQSLALFRTLGDEARAANALYELGNSSLQLGRWEAAANFFDEAARWYEARNTHTRLAYISWGMGLLNHVRGDEARSEAAYRRGLALAEDPAQSDLQLTDDLLWHLGLLYATQERWDEALAMYDRALALAVSLRRTHWVSLILHQRGNVLRRTGRIDEAAEAYRRAIDTIEGLRGDTEDEELKFGLLGSTQQIYEAMVLLCLEQGRTADAFHYVERARSRAFLDMLARKAPELYDTADQPVVTLADVQRTLPADALVIEYFTIGVLPVGEHFLNQVPAANVRLRSHLLMPPTTLIFAITHDRIEVYRSPLNPNTLRPLPSDPAPGQRFLWRERLLISLHERLIAPCDALLPDRSLVYIVPHGPLHYVPFMALHGATDTYLIDAERTAYAFAPSTTVLVRFCLARPASEGEGFLALGYDDMGDQALCYAELEARMLARLMGGEACVGPASKRPRLLAAAREVRWLHFAGHGVYTPDDPLASALRLGDGEALTARAIIGELDLRAELVTLSACTSGLSHIVSGDELLGLPRAFLYAGAPAVVCTLWETDDLVALLLMEQFFLGVRHGKTPAVALRDAQVAIRTISGRELAAVVARWRAHMPDSAAVFDRVPTALDDERPYAKPFYWAPFMLIGRANEPRRSSTLV